MSKQLIFIIVATVLAGGIVAGVWYAVQKPGPRDLSMPPIYEEPGYTQPDDSIVEVPQDTVSYPHDDPDSPYIDLDPKLHIAREITLDPEIITINNELKDVALCGETYKAKQVMINGVDVVQRVADLLAHAPSATSTGVCKRLGSTATKRFGGRIAQREELHIMIFKSDINNPDYMLGLSIGKSIKNDMGSWSGSFSIRVSESKDRIYFGNEVGPPNITGSLHE